MPSRRVVMSASRRRSLVVTDSSVIISSLVHQDPGIVQECRAQIERSNAVIGHVLAESYARITTMPGGFRLPPASAWQLLTEMFPTEPLSLSGAGYRRIVDLVSQLGVPGGAIYDCLIAETARESGAMLVSLDKRAASNYRSVGVDFTLL